MLKNARFAIKFKTPVTKNRPIQKPEKIAGSVLEIAIFPAI
jgi:hypothetical protein